MALVQIDADSPEFVDATSRESQRRVSFSSFLARKQLQIDAAAASSSGTGGGGDPVDFEFVRPKSPRGPDDSAAFPADELFYDGKMLPLEPLSRMAMVKDLHTMRRGGSSAPPSPYFSSAGSSSSGGEPSTTRKSSSYPPRGRSSRRFKDFFVGLKKCNSTPLSPPPQAASSSPASRPSSASILRSIFFGKKELSSSTSSSASTSSSSSSNPSSASSSTSSSSRYQSNGAAAAAAAVKGSSSKQRRNVNLRSQIGGGSGFSSPSSHEAMNFSRSAPATPLHHRAGGSAVGFVPVLHVPACIGPAKVSRFFSGSNKAVEVFM